jgi:hypothetical protein
MQITRRSVLARIGLLVTASEVLPSLTRSAAPAGSSSASSKATELIHDALIWDDHSGFGPVPDYDLEHLEDWRQAGVNYLSIDVGYDVIDWEQAIKNLGAYITWLEKRPDKFLLVRRVDDVLEAKKTGRMAITFDLEGMNALNGDSSLVALYYRLGVRQMLTAYNKNNLAGGGCHDKDTGLGVRPTSNCRDESRRHVGGLLSHGLPDHHGHHGGGDPTRDFFTFQSKDSAIARAQHHG